MLSLFKFAKWFREPHLSVVRDTQSLTSRTADYSFTVCKGDSIPSFWQADFRERGYKGDTVYFDRISVVDSTKSNMCKRIKCVIK